MKVGFTKLLLLLATTMLSLFCLSLILPSSFAEPFLLLELLSKDSDIARTIFLELRIPRTSLALIVGASLGLAGAAMQGLLRNPLAEPGVVGVSGSAALEIGRASCRERV